MKPSVWNRSDGERLVAVWNTPTESLLYSPENARALAAEIVIAAIDAEGPVVAGPAGIRCNDVPSLFVCPACRGEGDIVIGPRKSSMTVPCPECMPCMFDSAELFNEARAGLLRLQSEAKKEGST